MLADERGGKEYPPIRRMPEEEGKRRRRRRRVGKPRCEFLPLRPTSVSVAIWTQGEEEEEEDEEALLAHCRPCRRRCTARINNAAVPRRP